MNIDETKEKIEWRKHVLEYRDSYVIENRNKMINIHDNEVKNISKWNLLQAIINPPKRAKNINTHYSPILHGFTNTIKGRAKFKNFQIVLNSECSSTILTRRIVEKLCPEKDAGTQWQTQAGNITTNFEG